MPEVINKAGDIIIEDCYLLNFAGKRVDILALVSEIQIFEDIYSPVMSGFIQVIESSNLVVNLPLIGEEVFGISFHTPTKEKIERKFKVYKIGQRDITGNKHSYKVYFMSPEGYTDGYMQLAKAYTGQSEQIVTNILKTDLKSDRAIDVDGSLTRLKLVAPFWSPFKCINWVASHTLLTDQAKSADYLFFETNKKFVFKSLQTLKSAAVKDNYVYDHSRLPGGLPSGKNLTEKPTVHSLDRDYIRIHDARFNSMTDQLNRFNHGLYGTQTYVQDILFKTVRMLEYDYYKEFANQKHMNGFPQPSKGLHLVQNMNVTHTYAYPRAHSTVPVDLIGNVANHRIPMLAQAQMIKIDIDIWGRTDIAVGDTINVDLGKFTSNTADANSKNLGDPLYSGKYMIGAIVHRISMNQHKMTLQLTKDSVASNYGQT